MLEGGQEAEAGIFMEQAVDRGLLPAPLAAEAQRALDDHFRRTLYIPGGTAGLTMMEYTGDWQGRSRRLFAMAAKVAEAVGMDVAETDIGAEKVEEVFYGQRRQGAARKGVPLPADGTARVAVTIRNWTAKPRRWTAATTQPWIRPAKTRGAVAGTQELQAPAHVGRHLTEDVGQPVGHDRAVGGGGDGRVTLLLERQEGGRGPSHGVVGGSEAPGGAIVGRQPDQTLVDGLLLLRLGGAEADPRCQQCQAESTKPNCTCC